VHYARLVVAIRAISRTNHLYLVLLACCIEGIFNRIFNPPLSIVDLFSVAVLIVIYQLEHNIVIHIQV
jgi:hypothetical protein